MSLKVVPKKFSLFSSPPRPCYARAQLRKTVHNIHLKVRPSAKRPMSRRPCCRRRRGVVTQRPARTKFSGTNFSFREGKWSVKNLWPSGCWFCYCLSMWESLRSLLCAPYLRCNFLSRKPYNSILPKNVIEITPSPYKCED